MNLILNVFYFMKFKFGLNFSFYQKQKKFILLLTQQTLSLFFVNYQSDKMFFDTILYYGAMTHSIV
jgi:hypothetical protein